ncbi:hypothetical protein AHAS_Ahas05G0029000 [Arachis hypogaea]
MSNTTSGVYVGSSNITGYVYGIGIYIGIVFFITTITLTFYFCNRHHQQRLPPAAPNRRQNALEVGIDEESLITRVVICLGCYLIVATNSISSA